MYMSYAWLNRPIKEYIALEDQSHYPRYLQDRKHLILCLWWAQPRVWPVEGPCAVVLKPGHTLPDDDGDAGFGLERSLWYWCSDEGYWRGIYLCELNTTSECFFLYSPSSYIGLFSPSFRLNDDVYAYQSRPLVFEGWASLVAKKWKNCTF